MNPPDRRFAGQALVLCGLAARALGWRPHEFWQATPDELASVLAPPPADPSCGLDRATFNALMERDNER